MIPYTVRPLQPWIGASTQYPREAPFSANWSATLDLLDRELRMLGATRWVLELDVPASQIRNDGGVYARATPRDPAIRVAFESRHGPLIYACDRFRDWRDNVRAVALSLEALRKVDRYGVAGAGEQYRGWAQIEARPAPMTAESAAALIAEWAGLDGEYLAEHVAQIMTRPELLRDAYRRAAKRVHPDLVGDDGDSMARLNAARDLLTNGARS